MARVGSPGDRAQGQWPRGAGRDRPTGPCKACPPGVKGGQTQGGQFQQDLRSVSSSYTCSVAQDTARGSWEEEFCDSLPFVGLSTRTQNTLLPTSHRPASRSAEESTVPSPASGPQPTQSLKAPSLW